MLTQPGIRKTCDPATRRIELERPPPLDVRAGDAPFRRGSKTTVRDAGSGPLSNRARTCGGSSPVTEIRSMADLTASDQGLAIGCVGHRPEGPETLPPPLTDAGSAEQLRTRSADVENPQAPSA